MTGRLRHMVGLSLLWAIPGALNAGQYYLLEVYRDADHELLALLLADFLPWQVWALATPLVAAAGRRWSSWRTLPLHLLLGAAISVGYVWVQFHAARLAGLEPFVSHSMREMMVPLLIKSGIVQILLYGGVIAADRAISSERKRAQLEARLVEAHLDALRMQLRPHFLFNTLNAIAVLVRKQEGPGAIKMIHGLADLLRRSLSSLRVERVPLREELEFLQLYLDIVQVRFSDRLHVSLDVDPHLQEVLVPSLLLQPLVENAVEHGLAPRVRGGSLEIRAYAQGQTLHLEILDDGVGLRQGHREGVGLSHVRERLAQLYPGRHRFLLEGRPTGGTRAALELPVERP